MNEQSEFWKGEFGDNYNQRNTGLVKNNKAFFMKALNAIRIGDIIEIDNLFEFGCGTGNNLQAIHNLFPDVDLFGMEINHEAVEANVVGHVIEADFLNIIPPVTFDLTMTKGVLIHIHPGYLERAYRALYQASNRYILVAEYYNPTPVAIDYRGHKDKLWKRDFAGEMLSTFPDLKLIDYGFTYHRDQWPQDDLTWFLLGKTARQTPSVRKAPKIKDERLCI